MAAAGSMYIKVKPDVSAFRLATADQVLTVLQEFYGDLAGAAKALTQRFTILPGAEEEDEE